MFVSRSMTRRVVTIGPEASIFEVQELMAQNRIRHIPVVEEGDKLVGIVSDRDLRSALPFRYLKEGVSPEEQERLQRLRVKDIMTREVFTVSPAYTIQDALLMIQNSKVGALPVVDEEGRLKGILSVRDLLRAFINVLGIGQPGTLLCILVEEKLGQLKKIVDAITEMGVGFGSAEGLIQSIQALESPWDTDYGLPPLTIMELSPDSPSPNPNHGGGGPLVVRIDRKERLLEGDDADVIQRLDQLLAREDPDILLTDWGDSYCCLVS